MIVFTIATLICIWGLPIVVNEVKTSPNISEFLDLNRVISNLTVNKESVPIPEWSESSVLTKINDHRSKLGLNLLSVNSKLSNAAKSRLAVISEFSDYQGTQTGITREKAVDTTGYSYGWIGDLVLVGFFKINDPISYWIENPNSKQTLENKNFKDVGIALKQTSSQVLVYVVLASPQKKTVVTQAPVETRISWGGPELWAAVNKARSEHGVNPLQKEDSLCTIAAIRLNQILEKGKLDNHEGFVPTLNREDLKWISEKYNISEFLIAGFPTPEEAVKGWLNTLGHAKLITGGEYNKGCVYAQNTFGVAIAAY